MEERSLRVVGTDKTFFNKLTNTLTKFLIPTQIGITATTGEGLTEFGKGNGISCFSIIILILY